MTLLQLFPQSLISNVFLSFKLITAKSSAIDKTKEQVNFDEQPFDRTGGDEVCSFDNLILILGA